MASYHKWCACQNDEGFSAKIKFDNAREEGKIPQVKNTYAATIKIEIYFSTPLCDMGALLLSKHLYNVP